jgi:SAM-dependent methyltransferase
MPSRGPSERLAPVARPSLPDWFPGDDELIERLVSHQPVYRYRRPRYQIQLLKDLVALMPQAATSVLDVGAGNGVIADTIATVFPGKHVSGVDVAHRVLPTVRVPVQTYDGQRLPFEDASFDCALLCNVLHHVNIDQRGPLLQDILRVTSGGPIIIKDHLASSRLDHRRLGWLDVAGNAPFGGMVEATYLEQQDWNALFADLGCTAEILPTSPYRGPALALAFPNRLEICLRVQAAKPRGTD